MKQDLGAPFEAAELIAAVKKAIGRIDILVNNAGIIRRNDLLDYSLEDRDAVNAVNLRAVFQLSQAAAAEMVRAARGGRIINIASMLSYQGGIRVVGLHRRQARDRRSDKSDGERTRRSWHHGQRNRAGIHGNRQHIGAEAGCQPLARYSGAYPDGPMGHAG